jgi:4-alpha-glucanotransferase
LDADEFRQWTGRIKRCTELYDVICLDHFRGFCDYWEILVTATNGINEKWVDSVGIKFFEHLKTIFPNIELVAEDLGCLNNNVIKLLHETGLPGMNVLHFSQFAGTCRRNYRSF